MRAVFDTVPFDGRVAIGEGERDDAPMLWIGEPLGSMQGDPSAPSIDIAVDPLECTNHVALDLPNAMAVLSAGPRGSLLHAPDCYMDKIAGPAAVAGEVSLEADAAYNVEAACAALDKRPNDLRIVVMERPRHEDLLRDLRALDVDIVLIGDGDISAALEPAPKARTREGTKQATLIAMLRMPNGATIEEIMAATGWQSHTVRGAMAGALKKKLGLEVTSEKVENRGRVYKLPAA